MTTDNAGSTFHLSRCSLEEIFALTPQEPKSFFIQLWAAETCFLWQRPRLIKPLPEAVLYLRFVCQGLLSENKQLATVRVLCLSLWDERWRLHIMLCSSLLFTDHRLLVKWYKWLFRCWTSSATGSKWRYHRLKQANPLKMSLFGWILLFTLQ